MRRVWLRRRSSKVHVQASSNHSRAQHSTARARTMNETKPVLRPRRRCSSSRGHMILTLPMGPNRPNSRINTCDR